MIPERQKMKQKMKYTNKDMQNEHNFMLCHVLVQVLTVCSKDYNGEARYSVDCGPLFPHHCGIEPALISFQILALPALVHCQWV